MVSLPNNKYPSIVRPRRRRSRLLLGLLVIAALAVFMWHFQELVDWYRLRGYVAPAPIAQLATQDTFRPYTRHLFYLNRPQLLPTVASFRQHCPENPDTIVLGCYHPDQDGIYIYNVPDPTLAGVQQVTAAHEVLHSVYARLSGKERKQLNTELLDYYHHGLTDERVKAEIVLYQKTEPGSVMDEMSCTFGTEIAKLPASLETYYAQFFSNRAAIVAYEQQYEGEFTSRTRIIAQDDTQLKAMKAQIDSSQTSLSNQLTALTAQRAQLSNLLHNNQISQYNAGVPAYNKAVNAYNTGVEQLKALIDSYNQLVDSRNQVAGQLTTLDQALDTRLTTQSTR
jgi:hypothetical protein